MDAGRRIGVLLASVTALVTACTGAQETADPEPEPLTSVATPEPTPPRIPIAKAPTTFPRGCPEVFAEGALQTFEVEIDPTEWAKLRDEHENYAARRTQGLPIEPYHPLRRFKHGDVVITDAMIRLRGNPTYWFKQRKMQFQISFMERNPDGRFRGLRKLVLDSAHYNRSQLRDRLAMSILRDAGIPAPCVNHARLMVNGSFYGLYANIEKVDREFLERNFAEPDANLYKRGEVLKTNESDNPDTSVVRELWRVRNLTELDRSMDLDAFSMALAAEAVFPDADGYWSGGWNFYLYDHPERRLVYIPWDIDLAFDNLPATTDPLTWHKGAPNFHGRPHVELLLADPATRRLFVEHVGRVHAAADAKKLQGRIDAWSEQIRTAAALDAEAPWTFEEHRSGVRSLRAYVEERARYLDTWLRTAR